jgi:dsDNA-binding SOS-regulon protein
MEKHITLCEIIYKTNHNQKVSIEEEDILPSQRRLYQMLLEMGQKYNRLEEKVEEMSKWIAKKKKNINVLEWLNTHKNPLPTALLFETLHEEINVTHEDIEYLFTNTFFETVKKVFSQMISNIEESLIPICAFEQKVGLFYVYEKNMETNQYSWTQLSKEKLILFLKRLHRKISKALSDWKRNNTQKIKDDEKWDTIYDKTISKVMGIEIHQDTTCNKLKTILFHILKTDIKNILEYDFEF